jgi:hypothetical protein
MRHTVKIVAVALVAVMLLFGAGAAQAGSSATFTVSGVVVGHYAGSSIGLGNYEILYVAQDGAASIPVICLPGLIQVSRCSSIPIGQTVTAAGLVVFANADTASNYLYVTSVY